MVQHSEAVELGSHYKAHPIWAPMCDSLGCSHEEPKLQKPAKDTVVYFSKSLGPISASCIMWHCCDRNPASIFLWCNVPWCRYSNSWRLHSKYLHAYSTQSLKPKLIKIQKLLQTQEKLEDRGRAGGGHLYMQCLKRECNLWRNKTTNKGHPKKTVLSKLFSHLMEFSPAHQQFLSRKVLHYSYIHYS